MTTIEQPTDAPPKPPLVAGEHVLTAVREVMAEVIGIAKAGEMKQRGQTQYTFQKYDDMAAAVGKAFRSAGVATQTVLAGPPNVDHWEKSTQNGKTTWTWVQVTMRFVLTSLVDGSTFTVESVGEGLDSSDKATNKAMTGAYKNALKIAFTLSTADDGDPDATRPEATGETVRNAPQNGQPQYQPSAAEMAMWRSVETIAQQPPEQNSEPSRMENARQVLERIPVCATTGDLATLARWAVGKGALLADTGNGTTLAQRILAARGTLPIGPATPRQGG
jgi:hypothetical protein